MTKKQRPVTVSLPKPILEELDLVRGDIPRSKYIVRLLESRFGEKQEK
jgi:hypothetical protein